jgi:hypothetical protein
VVAGRALDHLGHPVERDRYLDRAAARGNGQAMAARARLTAPHGESEPVREHHRQLFHPRANRTVPERRRPCRVRRDDAAGERPGERRDRGEPGAVHRQDFLNHGHGHAGFDADLRGPGVEHAGELLRGQNDLAHRRRAAGQGRLRADRQHRCRAPDDVGDFVDGARNDDRGSVPAGEVRRVREILRLQPSGPINPRRGPQASQASSESSAPASYWAVDRPCSATPRRTSRRGTF